MGKPLPSQPEKMAGETTPLIQSVRVGSPRRRYPHHTARRFCTIACVCLLICGSVSFLFHTFFIWPLGRGHGHRHPHRPHPPPPHGHKGKHLSHEELQAILLETPSAKQAEEWSRYYTAGAHLAGKNYSQAEWTKNRWEEWGIKSSIAAYDVYNNYPLEHSVSLLTKESKDTKSWNVAFKASLTEDVLKDDPTTGFEDSIPTFHGYSATGNVTAPFVYVGYGTYQDFEDLREAGIELEGKIALIKYGGIFRGLKVKRAQEVGMVGVLIYSDPGDDGGITEENGFDVYPDGPARNPSSVQRGSVMFLSVRPGDPTTPGYASKPGVPRAPANETTPSIPSIPISYADAIPLLKALNGHGPKASEWKWPWDFNLGLGYKGVEYNIGPSPDNVVINLDSQQEYVTTPQWDTIGIINGTIPNEVIIVGNHRDAWIVGGAADPNSGSAILNEAVRSFGEALKTGWKPLRTIVFASWDGEEYGLVGSTEWVEEYLPWISDANVAYVNVDVGAAGPSFAAAAAPLLNQVLRDATGLVQSPNQTVKGQTIRDVWNGAISTMGSGSDFTAFQDYAGVPSIDMGFKNNDSGPVYHYHSNYDSFHWMSEFGDPGFVYHEAMSKLLAVLVGELANRPIIPFKAAEYAESLNGYLDQVEAALRATHSEPYMGDDIFTTRAKVTSKVVTGSEDAFEHSIKEIKHAIKKLKEQADKLDARAAEANRQLEEGFPWWNIIGKIRLAYAIIKVNTQYKYLERNFLFEGGLDNRSWFKHVVYAPGLWTGYAGAVYPGLLESIDAKDYGNGLKWARIIKNCVDRAAKSIE